MKISKQASQFINSCLLNNEKKCGLYWIQKFSCLSVDFFGYFFKKQWHLATSNSPNLHPGKALMQPPSSIFSLLSLLKSYQNRSLRLYAFISTKIMSFLRLFFSHLAKNFLKFCYRKFPNVHYLSIMKFLLVNHYIGFWSIARDIVWNLDKKFIINRKKNAVKTWFLRQYPYP